MSPRRHLQRLVEQWPQISEDLVALPEVMHRLVRSVTEERQAPAAEAKSNLSGTQLVRSARGLAALGSVLAIGGGGWLVATMTPAWAGWLALGVGIGLLAGTSRRLR